MASLIRKGSGRIRWRITGDDRWSDDSMTSVTLAADGAGPFRDSHGRYAGSQGAFKSARPVLPVIGIVIKNSHGGSILGPNNKFIGGYHFERTASGTISCIVKRSPSRARQLLN